MPHTDSTRRFGNTLPALVSLVQYFHDEENPYGFPSYAVPYTASKALLRQIDEACGKREEGGEEANEPIMERTGRVP